jgi:hypothetical protein
MAPAAQIPTLKIRVEVQDDAENKCRGLMWKITRSGGVSISLMEACTSLS